MATRARRATAAARPQLRVIPGGSPRRTTLPFAVVLVGAVFAVAALQAYLGQEGFRMSQVESELRRAEERYTLLRAELAELGSPSALETAAVEMGLTADADPVFLPAPPGLGATGLHGSSYEAKGLLTGPSTRRRE